MAYIDGAAAPQQWVTVEELQRMFGGAPVVPSPPTPVGLAQPAAPPSAGASPAPAATEAPTAGTRVPLPAPRPRPPAQVPTENTAAGLVEQGRQALREGGSLLPEGWRGTVYDTLKGALGVDPTAGKLTNFLSGLLGAIESRQTREQAEQDRLREEEDRALSAEDRARAEEDRLFDREGDLLGRERTRAEIDRINRQDRPTSASGALTPDQVIDLNNYMMTWTLRNYGESGISYLRGDDRTAAQAAIAAERDRVTRDMLGGVAPGAPGPSTGGSASPGGISEGATATGPNGERIQLRGGVWVDMATGQPFAGQ